MEKKIFILCATIHDRLRSLMESPFSYSLSGVNHFDLLCFLNGDVVISLASYHLADATKINWKSESIDFILPEYGTRITGRKY